jgi:DNA polymerase/3'-5' exonuclease PolX
MSLREAQRAAAAMYSALESHAARLIVVGSVRRERRYCNDVEIVVEPHMAEDLLGERTALIEPLHHQLREMGQWRKGGDRWVQIEDVFGHVGVGLDVAIVHPPAQWGSIVAIRTGPWQLGKYCVSKMRARGFRHELGHVVSVKTSALIPTPHEDNFFELAGVPNVAPSQRDALAQRLGLL